MSKKCEYRDHEGNLCGKTTDLVIVGNKGGVVVCKEHYYKDNSLTLADRARIIAQEIGYKKSRKGNPTK